MRFPRRFPRLQSPLRRRDLHRASVVMGIIAFSLSVSLVKVIDVALSGAAPQLQPVAQPSRSAPVLESAVGPDGADGAMNASFDALPSATAEAVSL
ncbi:MAG: hypothetical protein ABW032_00450 [Burkholderiaceae bacterium]